MLTAIVTLGAAAFTLLAPLESQLKTNSLKLTEAVLSGAKTQLGVIPLVAANLAVQGPGGPAGGPDRRRQPPRHARRLGSSRRRALQVRQDRPSPRRRDQAGPGEDGLRGRRIAPVHSQAGGLLDIASRYRARGRPARPGRARSTCSRCSSPSMTSAGGQRRALGLRRRGAGRARRGAPARHRAVLALCCAACACCQDATAALESPTSERWSVPHEMVPDEIGELARAFATMHAHLRQQEDARRAFVATASHELRTPLTSLDGMLELLADDLTRDPIDLVDARERVARAQQQSRRLGAWRRTCSTSAASTRSSSCAASRSSSGRRPERSRPNSTRARARAPSRSRSTRSPAMRGLRPTLAASRASCASCSTTRCGSHRPTR